MFGRRKLVHSQLVIKLNGCRCRHMEIMVPFYPTYCAYLDSLVLQTMSFGDVIHTMALLLQVLYFPLSIEVLNVERYGNLKYGFCRWLLNLSWCCVVNQAPVNINTTLVGKRSKRHGPVTNKVGRSCVSSALVIRIVKWWLMLSGDCSILFKIGYWD